MKLIRWIFKRLQIKSLQKKILFAQLLFAVIPLIVLASLMMYFFNGNIAVNHEENLKSRLNVVSQAIENQTDRYLSRSQLIVNNSYAHTILKDVIRGEYEGILDMQNLVSSLTIDLIPQRFRTAFFTFYVDGYNFGDSIYMESIQNFPEPEIKDVILKLPSNEVVWRDGIYIDSAKELFLVFYRNISPFSHDAILRVSIPYKEIQNVLNQFAVDEEDFIVIHKNSAGNPVYFRDNSGQYKEYGDLHTSDFLLMNSRELPDGSIITLGLNQRSIRFEHFMTYGLVIIFFSLTLFFTYTATKMTSKKIIRGLHFFVDTISYDENLLLKEIPDPDEDPDDEVGIIKKRFIATLREMEETHKLILDVRNEKNLIEINLLQARLNPHMLYNSLSAIRMCATGNDNEKTTALVDALASYYRLALNKGIDVITVSQELEMIRQYMNIIRLTYSREDKLLIHLENGIGEMTIFKHLLQPLVENALHHGLRGLPREGEIEIHGWRETRQGENFIIFQVKDNGFGMEENRIQKIMKKEYTSLNGGFGIKNLIEKIDAFYGKECGLKIESSPGEWAVITITVKEIM